ncbi:MAG: hypothetical protein SFY95_07965, partial [Planctomycetota bacterium]|nr:hypothetical protein [Planctomycetota bacterium]
VSPPAGFCIRCGYDLLGLPSERVCPECGTPIALSRAGGMLVNSAPEYLKRLSDGLTIIIVTALAGLMLILIGLALGFLIGDDGRSFLAMTFVLELLGVVAAGAAFLGGWWFSAPDPARVANEQTLVARQVFRGALIASAALTLLSALLSAIELGSGPSTAVTGAGIVVAVLSLGALALQFFAAMRYVRSLGARMPDPAVIARARRYTWLLPVLVFPGVLLFGLGVLFAVIFYYIFLWQVRGRINAIRREQAAMAAAA